MPASTVQSVRVELVLQLGRVLGQVAVRSELDPLVARLDHLARNWSAGTCSGSLGNQTPHESGAVPMVILDHEFSFLLVGF